MKKAKTATLQIPPSVEGPLLFTCNHPSQAQNAVLLSSDDLVEDVERRVSSLLPQGV